MRSPNTPITSIAREPAITVVVPVYDNAGSLPALHARLEAALLTLHSPFEIVYVNDASGDDSLAVLSRLHASADNVTLVDLADNAGQSAAVLAGLSLARGGIVVTIDADLENHPEDVPKLVAAIRAGADVACGVRRRRSAPLLTRRGPSAVANGLVGRALGVDLEDWGCGLNAGTAEIVRQLLAEEPPPALPKVEAVLLASRIAQVPVGYSERAHGPSTYTLRRLGAFAARFLRAFAVRRSLRRLLAGDAPHVVTTDGATVRRSAAAHVARGVAGVGAWAVLTAAALAVRVWSGSDSRRPPFRIRELRASRGAALPEQLLHGALRQRPHDVVSRRR
jgi:hypothetical protein